MAGLCSDCIPARLLSAQVKAAFDGDGPFLALPVLVGVVVNMSPASTGCGGLLCSVKITVFGEFFHVLHTL